ARLPLSGYVSQEGKVTGFYGDGWASHNLEARLKPGVPFRDLYLRGYRPPEAGAGKLRLLVDDQEVLSLDGASGTFELRARVPSRGLDTQRLQILFEPEKKWVAEGESRDLA